MSEVPQHHDVELSHMPATAMFTTSEPTESRAMLCFARRRTCGSGSDAPPNRIMRIANLLLTTLVLTFFVRDADTGMTLRTLVNLVDHASWSRWVTKTPATMPSQDFFPSSVQA